jgi:hypothetical protein
MAFSNNTPELIGHKLQIKPVLGNRWGLYGMGSPEWLDTPSKDFEACVIEVLFEKDEARVLICELKIILAGHEFVWAALIARADEAVDLRINSVHCNMIFSKEKPSISPEKPYPDPLFVNPNANPYVRGFGFVSV